MRVPALSLLFLVVLSTGCDPFSRPEKNGDFLENPVNLIDFNSEYDDYNSALPSNKYGVAPLIFSSKRSLKTKFNLVYELLNLRYDEKERRLTANNKAPGNLDAVENALPLNGLVSVVNGDYNVLGPNVLASGVELRDSSDRSDSRLHYLLLYADDRDGNLNIRFCYNQNAKTSPQGPFEVKILNGPADDAYPTFFDKNGARAVYFTSNRGGNFDIYRVRLPQNKPLFDVLRAEQTLPVEKVSELSTTSDDKCPFIYNNTMVFTSNRPGGQGGFDLYVSRYENGQWSKPENLGSRLNTAADEYRPILVKHIQFTYNLMIFSSNRPGGKGGFDLYMAGLEGSPY